MTVGIGLIVVSTAAADAAHGEVAVVDRTAATRVDRGERVAVVVVAATTTTHITHIHTTPHHPLPIHNNHDSL